MDHGEPSKDVWGATVAGKFQTKLKQHHPAQYQEALLKEEEAEQKKIEVSAKCLNVSEQLIVVKSFQGKTQYDKSSQQYVHNNLLCLLEARMFLRNSIVDDDDLRSFVIVLNSRSPMLGRTLIGKKLDKVLTTFKQNIIKGFLSQAHRASLCAGIIWSKGV